MCGVPQTLVCTVRTRDTSPGATTVPTITTHSSPPHPSFNTIPHCCCYCYHAIQCHGGWWMVDGGWWMGEATGRSDPHVSPVSRPTLAHSLAHYSSYTVHHHYSALYYSWLYCTPPHCFTSLHTAPAYPSKSITTKKYHTH